ncbi:hypothetical protein pEaSNUABM56_00128 [Erwinia phage pEa_SNUABM_56]|uniref:Uncharacterized protein n=1 Tax=Erwinia phage pEp_SNUABM_01 TaxID=2601643 RepID=A0A5J6DAU2_9CAUD|nr:Rz-like spanin [Erwinia phage pEp_SNUABM_01]QEQ94927.1 hypothetical protein pEpSNUABM01_101 [Erwinia phage pEp_SNUABM_01]UYL84857.1 hypothetical protein pEaSNUABM55_00059 [Erwinia phage pEa_SNUABM_55]UYL85173.1 hypothetical protein pEaSNUABM56_00128 [Erwinia phage pEa_SNUABM_56]
MISLTDLIALVKRYKKVFAAGILAIALVIGALWVHSWYEDQLTAQYNTGVQVTDTKWEGVMKQNKDAQDKFKAEQQALVDGLNADLAAARAENDSLKADNDNKQNTYAQSEDGKKTGLDDAAVDIYNQSLGIGK